MTNAPDSLSDLSEPMLVAAAQLSQVPLASSPENALRALVSSPVDWSSLFLFASRLDSLSLVCQNLVSHFSDDIPGSIRNRAQTISQQERAKTLATTMYALEILRILRQEGVDCIVLKGPAVGVQAYSDPSMRPYLDLDVMVPEAQVHFAVRLLMSEGFDPCFPLNSTSVRLARGNALDFKSSRLKIDLHTTLMERYLQFGIRDSEAWDESVWVRCLGSSIKTLAIDHQILFLCAHGAKHQWTQLRWVNDIAHLLRAVDNVTGKRIETLAERVGCVRILRAGLRLAEEIFFSSSSGLSEFLKTKPDRIAETIVRQRVARIYNPDYQRAAEKFLVPPSLQPVVYWIGLRERFRDKARVVATLTSQAWANRTSTP